MANIVSLSVNAKTFFNTAKDFIKQKDYYEAIKYLNQAVKYSNQPEYLSTLADTYYRVGAYNHSTNVYLRLLQLKLHVAYIFSIARNIVATSDMEAAARFIDNSFEPNTYSRFSSELLDIPMDLYEKPGEFDRIIEMLNQNKKTDKAAGNINVVNLKKIKDKSRLDVAIEHFRQGNYDLAVQIAQGIDKRSDYYINSLELIIECAVGNKDALLARPYLDIVFEKKPLSVSAYSALLLFAKQQKNYYHHLSYPEILARLIELIKTSSDKQIIAEICKTLAAVGSFKHMYIVSSYLAELDCQKDKYLANHIFCCHLAGKKDEAKSLLKQMHALYPNDRRIKLFEWLIKSKATREVWRFIYLIKKIDEISEFYDCFEHSVRKNHQSVDKDVYPLLDIIVCLDALDMFEYVINKLLSYKDGFFREYLIGLLCDQEPSIGIKYVIMTALLSDGINKVIDLYLEDRFKNYRLRSLEGDNINQLLRQCYNEVHANLILEDSPISPKILTRITQKLLNKKFSKKDKAYIKAFIHYYYSVDVMDKPMELDYFAHAYGIKKDRLIKWMNRQDLDD